eukprot:360740-Chlamydomonas_euryale.AAC.4
MQPRPAWPNLTAHASAVRIPAASGAIPPFGATALAAVGLGAAPRGAVRRRGPTHGPPALLHPLLPPLAAAAIGPKWPATAQLFDPSWPASVQACPPPFPPSPSFAVNTILRQPRAWQQQRVHFSRPTPEDTRLPPSGPCPVGLLTWPS